MVAAVMLCSRHVLFLYSILLPGLPNTCPHSPFSPPATMLKPRHRGSDDLQLLTPRNMSQLGSSWFSSSLSGHLHLRPPSQVSFSVSSSSQLLAELSPQVSSSFLQASDAVYIMMTPKTLPLSCQPWPQVSSWPVKMISVTS